MNFSAVCGDMQQTRRMAHKELQLPGGYGKEIGSLAIVQCAG